MFQHDNASKDKVKCIKTLYVKVGLEEPLWPAQCPDLNYVQQVDVQTYIPNPHHPELSD